MDAGLRHAIFIRLVNMLDRLSLVADSSPIGKIGN